VDKSTRTPDYVIPGLRPISWQEITSQEKSGIDYLRRCKMITEQQIHYFKTSIRKFKEAPRIKVNMTIVNKEGIKKDFTWRLTQERREIYNSLEGAEDDGWNKYQEYVDAWKDLRKAEGQNVKLWIGKLTHRAKWSKGAQPLERVPFAVGLLMLNRSTQELEFMFNIDDWRKDFELQTIEGAQYNRVFTWQNPLTSVVGRRTRSLF
tara:strand:- start:433 stop:1050 length:618 start_codon:yes stop_codon:yes gene_type:complete